MGFIKRCKEIWQLSQRIRVIENEIKEIDQKLEIAVREYSKQFEKKVQDMASAYVADLDDVKSDYLKRYVEQRLNGMQYDIKQIGEEISCLGQNMDEKLHRLENIEE